MSAARARKKVSPSRDIEYEVKGRGAIGAGAGHGQHEIGPEQRILGVARLALEIKLGGEDEPRRHGRDLHMDMPRASGIEPGNDSLEPVVAVCVSELMA